MKEEILRLEQVNFRVKGRYQLKDFHLNVYKGEVLIVMGHSGMGLHELGQVLSGYPAESGRFLLKERELPLQKGFSPEQNGIYVIHENHNLMPDMSIAENLFLTQKKNMFELLVSRKKQEFLARDIMKHFGLEYDVRKKAYMVGSYYEHMIIKMVKAYVKGATLVVIDEIMEIPQGKESRYYEQFERVIHKLVEDGISVVWLTQRIDSIRKMADRIVILREGKNVKTYYDRQVSLNTLQYVASENRISHMQEEGEINFGEEIFRMEHVKGIFLQTFSMRMYRRQIVGIVCENVRQYQELSNILTGERFCEDGIMYLDGEIYAPKDIKESVKSGILYADCMWSEKQYIFDMDVADNILLSNYWKTEHHYLGQYKKMKTYLEVKLHERHPNWNLKKWYRLKPEQQRLLLYEKYLYLSYKLLILLEPFAKVNYEQAREICNVLKELQRQGRSILLISANPLELSSICDQIITIT